MILIAAALLCVASVPLTGGRLSRLVHVQLRLTALALAALAVQVIITTIAPGGSETLHEAVHLATYLMAGAFIVANRRITGLPVLALGAALNLAAIAANHGIMPASQRAMRLAGLPPAEGFANSAAVAHPRLLALGDIIPLPGPWPLGNVMSIGDLLILAGLLVILHTACGAPRDAVSDVAAAGQRSVHADGGPCATRRLGTRPGSDRRSRRPLGPRS
jgi:hypothetical protein